MTRDEYMRECEVFVRRAVRRHRQAIIGQPVDVFDLAQHGRTAALDAWRNIDQARSRLEQLAFARTCISRAINRLVHETWMDSSDAPIGSPSIAEVGRWKRRQSRDSLQRPLPLNEHDNRRTLGDIIPAPSDDLDAYVDARSIVRRLWSETRSETERQIVMRFEMDEERHELAARLGCSRQNIHQIERRLFERMWRAA